MRLLTRLTELEPVEQRFDARVLVMLTFCLILVTRSVSEPSILLGLQLALLGAAWLFRIGVFRLLTRSALVLPFTLAALPLLFTVQGSHFFAVAGFTASWEGLGRWLLVVAHCYLCYQVLLLAVMLAGPFGFIQGMAGLGFPAKLISILRLALRYLDVLLDEARRMRRARALRGGRDRRSVWARASTTGAMIGTLFLRSLDRASRLQLARSCRGGPLQQTGPALSVGQRIKLASFVLVTSAILVFQSLYGKVTVAGG